MRTEKWRMLAAAGVLTLAAGSAKAVVLGFAANPTGNSADWAASVAGLGGTVNGNVDFEAHGTGALNGAFYSLSDGVTLSGSGLGSVTLGSGPGQGNTASTPKSPGEGVNAPSNYLFMGVSSRLVVSFDAGVLGAGLDLTDIFDPLTADSTILEAFGGVGGTGALLGSISAPEFNYQKDGVLFMGFTDSSAGIRSIVVTHDGSTTGDVIGADNIVFAPFAVPEPASVGMLALGLLGVAARRGRRAG